MTAFVVLEEVDAGTNCVVRKMLLEVDDVRDLKVGLQDVTELDRRWLHLDPRAGKSLAAQFSFAHGDGNLLRLRSRSSLDDLSYEVHTGRELLLMLLGEKPLAAFCYSDGEEFSTSCDQPFEAYVNAGRLKRTEFTVETALDQRGRADVSHWVLFTLPGEAWRAQAYERLVRAGEAWTERAERMQGTLLGYTDAQNDEYIERIFNAQD